MKKITIVRCIAAVFILLAGILTAAHLKYMRHAYDSVSIRLEEGISKKELLSSIKQEAEEKSCKVDDITGYSVNQDVVEGKELNHSVQVNCYQIYGDVEKVMPVSLMEGNLLIRDDTDGCVITKKTAYKLFGSTHVIGQEVAIQNKTYVIRGIVTAKQEAVFFEAEKESDTFHCLELTIQDDNGEYYANQYTMIYGLSNAEIIEGNYLVLVFCNLYLIIICLILIYLISLLYITLKRKSVVLWKRCGILILGSLVVVLTCKYNGYFFERWIPDKWSNFDYYSTISSQISEEINQLLFSKPMVKEVLLKSDFYKGSILMVVTFIGAVYVLHLLRDLLRVDEEKRS